MGQGEKLMDVGQPAFPRGKKEEETRDGLLAERGREKEEKEQRRGAIFNLVYCVKKSHMHSRPHEGPHAPVWPWWTLAPGLVPCPSQVRAELLLLLGWWRDLQPVCWSLCGGKVGGQPCDRRKNTKMPHFK